MMRTFLTQPLLTFLTGLVVATFVIYLIFNFFAPSNRSSEAVESYHVQLNNIGVSGIESGSPGEIDALENIKNLLKGIGDSQYVRDNTQKVYAADAYLDDTLVVHRGAAAIEEYFLKTSKAVTDYKVTIDDVARSGNDYYIRWTMVFVAPVLSGGQPVHSIGISQIRLNREGKVAFHQDFWDSGKNFFAHLPVVSGAIGLVRKCMESN